MTALRPPAQADEAALLAFSGALEGDETPCSFWGLTPARIEQWLADDSRSALLCEENARLLGVGACVQGGDFQRHLGEVSVAVAPEARRRGVASALLDALEADATTRGIHLLKALIWVRNAESRAFFASRGYEHRATLISEFRSDRFGEIDDCVYYKRLDGRPL